MFKLLLLYFVLINNIYNVISTNNDIPKWKWWPPLPSKIYFTGQYSSYIPHKIQDITPPNTIINPFNLTERSNIAYGSIIKHYIDLNLNDSDTKNMLNVAIEYINNRNKRLNKHIYFNYSMIQKVIQLPLKATYDNTNNSVTLRYQYINNHNEIQYFEYDVHFGYHLYFKIKQIVPFTELHYLTLSYDLKKKYHLIQHTFKRETNEMDIKTSKQMCFLKEKWFNTNHYNNNNNSNFYNNIRIGSYNIWNVNPPTYIYGYKIKKYRYLKRMKHFIQIIKDSFIDIIGIQEIRYDSTLGTNSSQIELLIHCFPTYQYIYQPAMIYINPSNPFEKIEEGIGILSKYPIIETDYLLLSRNPNDPNDEHQRICLRALIKINNKLNSLSTKPIYIEIYNTHLSLSEKSRHKTILEIYKYMNKNKIKQTNTLIKKYKNRNKFYFSQFLIGDLNSESRFDQGIEFLQGFVEWKELNIKNNINQIYKSNLIDTFLKFYNEPIAKSKKIQDKQFKFTFPSNDPEKRIDYIFYRGNGNINEFKVIGQDPVNDTFHLNNNYNEMNHINSPIWASDHYGVFVNIVYEYINEI